MNYVREGRARSRAVTAAALTLLCVGAIAAIRFSAASSATLAKTKPIPSASSQPVGVQWAQPAESLVQPGDAPVHGLSGAVLAATGAGQPIANANVCLIAAGTEDIGECYATNQSGRFFVPLDRCQAGARLVASATGYSSSARRIDGEAGCADQNVTLSLERGGAEVAGTVVDATGGFVPGARVTAYVPASSDAPSTTLTVADGSFRLSAPAGPIELVATAEAYSRAVRTVTVPQSDVVLVLAPASSIVGEVVLQSGEAVPGAQLTAVNPNGTRAPKRTVRTDAAGHFVLSDLAAGGYELSATSEKLRTEPQWVSVAVGEQASTRLVAVSASTLRASVDVSGAPCVAGHVTLEGPTGASQPIDAAGNVRWDGLARGRYQVSVRCTAVMDGRLRDQRKPRKSFAELADVVLVNQDIVSARWSATEPEQADERVEEMSVLDADKQGGSISGRVLDERGSPLPEAWVTAVSASARSSAPVLTDVSGGFVLQDLPEGKYQLSATSSSGEGRVSGVPINSANVRIQVTLYGSISGSVQALDGTLPDAFTLVYRRRDDSDIKSVNGAQGKWALPWLPAGSYRLSAIATSGCGWTDTQLEPGGKAQVSIALNRSGDACSAVWRADAAALPPKQ